MKRRWLLLAGPIVAGHAGCIASPALAVALGLPVVMPICGDGIAPVLAALGPVAGHMMATMAIVGLVAFWPRLHPARRRGMLGDRRG